MIAKKRQMRDYIRINPIDNVAVALTTLEKGTAITIDGREIVLSDCIQRGHKFALYPISRDGVVVKYGSVIGSALCDIAPGCHVHTHNIKTNLNDKLEYSYSPATFASLPLRTASFMGFHRPDGRAGVRNELWIIPTVGCVNSVARRIAQDCARLAAGSIDTVTAFTHPYGCSQMDDDQESTRRILADLIHHPNAGGVLVLGCPSPRVLKDVVDADHDVLVQLGVAIRCGWGPKEILAEAGRVTGIVLKRCVSVFDENGRFCPRYDEADTITVPCEHVFLSIGQSIRWGSLLDGAKVELGRGGAAVADPLTYQTAQPDIFVGGDVYTGPKFAIDAIAAGKQGAESLHRFVHEDAIHLNRELPECSRMVRSEDKFKAILPYMIKREMKIRFGKKDG